MPPALEATWSTHGYYGSVSHNVKAICQRYLGWYDGNPAHLWPHPPAGTTTFTLTRPALIGLVTGALDLATAITDGTVRVDGDPADLQRLVDLLAPVDPDFAIVTP